MSRAVSTQAGGLRQWGTRGLPAAEQFGSWGELVGEAFVDVSVSRAGEGAFPSAITAQAVGGMGVSRIRSGAQSVERTEAHIRRAAGDVYFLNMPLTDGSTATQAGRTAVLGAGDFTVIDGSRPFALEFGAPFGQISLTLPHDVLEPLLTAPADTTSLTVSGDHGAGAVAAGAIRGLAMLGPDLDRREQRALMEQTAALVATSLNAARRPAARRPAETMVEDALAEIERSLGDPQLGPAAVAERVGMSTRYLHQLMSARGVTFGRWVLARRLAACHADLGDPASADSTIADIARDRGFADPSYMARAYRARYGCTPSERRRNTG